MKLNYQKLIRVSNFKLSQMLISVSCFFDDTLFAPVRPAGGGWQGILIVQAVRYASAVK